MRLYLDSSALVRLIQREPESDALRRFLRGHHSDHLVTCALARLEVVRAVFPGGRRAVDQARRQLTQLDQIVLSAELLDRAAILEPATALRSLDAIHLAAAQFIGDELRAVVTYDRRMAEAAVQLGLGVAAPS